jgi:hypothetical protein
MLARLSIWISHRALPVTRDASHPPRGFLISPSSLMNYYRALRALSVGKGRGNTGSTVPGDVDEERVAKCDVGIFISPIGACHRLHVSSEDRYRFKWPAARSPNRGNTCTPASPRRRGPDRALRLPLGL